MAESGKGCEKCTSVEGRDFLISALIQSKMDKPGKKLRVSCECGTHWSVEFIPDHTGGLSVSYELAEPLS